MPGPPAARAVQGGPVVVLPAGPAPALSESRGEGRAKGTASLTEVRILIYLVIQGITGDQ